MSKSWSTEDRYSFEKSEVMQELEAKVIETIKKADILSQKIAVNIDQNKITQDKQAIDALNTSLKETKELISGAEDDACDGKHDYVEDDADTDLQDDIINDLLSLASAAVKEGNIKLAYRIERTIDEIMEQKTPCI